MLEISVKFYVTLRRNKYGNRLLQVLHDDRNISKTIIFIGYVLQFYRIEMRRSYWKNLMMYAVDSLDAKPDNNKWT